MHGFVLRVCDAHRVDGLVTAVFSILLICCSGVRLRSEDVFLVADSRVVVEAEDFDVTVPRGKHEWLVVPGPEGASLGGAIVAAPDAGSRVEPGDVSTSAQVQYRVHLDVPGIYWVWARVHAPSAESDSLHLGLDGVRALDAAWIGVGGESGEWRWVSGESVDRRARVEVRAPGVHTIDVWIHEDGVFLDKILLSREQNYVPIGTGPAESRRGEAPDVEFGPLEGSLVEFGGYVCAEAENFDTLVSRGGNSWSTFPAGGAVGRALSLLPDRGEQRVARLTEESPEAVYEVLFSRSGRFHVWLRVFAPSAGSDSLFVGLDGDESSAIAIDTGGVHARWVWTRATLDGGLAHLDIDQSGEHSLHLWMREDGLSVDRFLLTTSGSFRPEADGPEESPRVDLDVNHPPVVTLVSPLDQATFVSGANVSIEATASDADGSVSRVEFRVDGEEIAVRTRAPWIAAWTPPSVGRYLLSAIAIDSSGDASVPDSIVVDIRDAPPPPPPQGTGAFVETGGLVVFEAEDHDGSRSYEGHDWSTVSMAGAVADLAMLSTPDSDVRREGAYVAQSPELVYRVLFTTPGDYVVWARVRAPSDRSDSFHAGLDGDVSPSAERIDSGGVIGVWTWTSLTMDLAAATVSVATPGVRTFHVWMREDGLAIDRIALARNGGFQPSGAGPAASPRDGEVANEAPRVSITSPASGNTVLRGEPIVVDALVEDTDGSVAAVELWAGERLLAIDRHAPYRFDLAPATGGGPYPASRLLRSLVWESRVRRFAEGNDAWPMTWMRDGQLFTSFADGTGFPPASTRLSLGLATISGGPLGFTGRNLRAPSIEDFESGALGQKPADVLSVGGVLYLWIRNDNGAGAESRLAWSLNQGSSWTRASWRWRDLGFPAFVQFGRDYEGARDGFVYVISHDHPSAYENADRFVLARAPARQDALTSSSSWEFFIDRDDRGEPTWGSFAERGAVFEDPGRCRRSSISFNAALGRYLFWQQKSDEADSRFEGGFAVYEAPEPWGPWGTVYATESWDVGPGERATFPTKWMSPDGLEAYLVFSGDDALSLRKASFTIDGSAATLPLAPLGAGVFSLVARATDHRGAVGSSDPITLTIEEPRLGTDGVFVETQARLVFEAESFASSHSTGSHAWRPDVAFTGRSGAAVLHALPDSDDRFEARDVDRSPELVYRVRVATPGRFQVWLRVFATSSRSDSVHCGVDGQTQASADRVTAGERGEWHWTSETLDGVAASVEFDSPGEHTFHIWMREDGSIVDRVALVRDAGFVPTGMGPPSSPEERAVGPDGGGIAGDALQLRGDLTRNDAIGIDDAWTLLSSLFVAGAPPLECAAVADFDEDGRVSVSDAIALLEHWRDPATRRPASATTSCPLP